MGLTVLRLGHNVFHMEHKQGIAEAIKEKLGDTGTSDRALATATGIPATTLDRKLKLGGDTLTLRELKLIANALNTEVLELIKGSA